MHILVTADALGGVWTYTTELVTGLVRRGIKVTLVSFGDIPSAAQTHWLERLPQVDFRPTAFKLEWMQDSEADMEASSQYLTQVIEEIKPDLLHLNQFYYGALPGDIPRVVVAHSDVISWWSTVHQHPPAESAWLRWYRESIGRGLACATAVVAPTHWMLEQVKHNYGQPANSLVVYNGRTPTNFNPHVSKEDLIITVGRLWDSGKNVRLLLREDMPAPVQIVGADRHPELQSSAFAFEEIRTNVHLEPQQDENQLAQMLSRAAIYAATSRYEPFGLAPLEAALSRCAIVASDIPPFRELWGGAAIFFRSDDATDLRHTLQRVVQDQSLRQHYANLAYAHARKHYSAARMIDEYLELYHALAPAGVVTG
ncbi:MAG TPA: glycosyltransferase family 4 protein [Candidatus Angelobacter sp.]|nr:glycosyltransferase family 4 protein [Candidatus Angelobacter sp.]